MERIQSKMEMEGSSSSAFSSKVERTVYVDNLSPNVTETVLKTALGQFGTVKNIEFLPNYFVPGNPPICALVEMDNKKQASSVVSIVAEFPFMISGMPRPVRARPARPEMFHDRPPSPNPNRRIRFRWIGSSDPDFEVAQKLKRLASRHSGEAAVMLSHQQKEEAELASRQSDALKATYKKYDTINSVLTDKSANRLASRYNLKLRDH